MAIDTTCWVKVGENQWKKKEILLEDTSWREMNAMRDVVLDQLKLSHGQCMAFLYETKSSWGGWYLYSPVRDNFIPVNSEDCEHIGAIKLYKLLLGE